MMGRALGLLVLVPNAEAIDWSRNLQGPGWEEATWVTATSDGGALVAGTSYDLSGMAALLARTNADGTVRWSLRHGTGTTEPNGFVMLPGEESLVMGMTTVSPGNYQGWTARFDADGAVLWDRTILRFQGGRFDDADTLGSGEIALAGWSGFPIVSARPAVLGLDAGGNLAWQLGLDCDGNGHIGIVATDDGGFLLVGGIEADGFVAKFDASQRIAWQRRIGDTDMNRFSDAIQVADGGFVLRGSTLTGGVIGSWLVRLSASGAVEWSVVLSPGFGAGGEGVQACPDGGFIISSGGSSTGIGGRLSKVDANGDLLWVVAHGIADSRSRGMSLAPDSGIFFVGFDRDPVTTQLTPWLLRLDAQGLAPSACSSSPFSAWIDRPPMDVTDTTYAVIDPGVTIEPTVGATTTRDILVARPRCLPGEVTGVQVRCTAPGAMLTWEPLAEVDEYEVYRGNLPAVMPLAYDHVDVGACNVTATTWTDSLACSDSRDWYYLVIARNWAGRGPYGTNSLGVTLPPAASECP